MRSPAPVPLPDSAVPITAMPMAAPIRFGGGPRVRLRPDGPVPGGQAEYLRVPFADFNLLPLPPGEEFERDFTMLSDIFPTGYHGAALAGVVPGDTAAVFGAGPVGLLAAHSSYLRGAARVFVADMHRDRLALAARFGATPVSIADGDPAEQILDATGGPARTAASRPSATRRTTRRVTNIPRWCWTAWFGRSRRPAGSAWIGVYVPSDPQAASQGAQQGRIGFDYGTFFQKGQQMGTGQCPVKRYNERLRDLIIAGRATPSLLVSHELSLDQAPEAYDKFDKRTDGYTKVLLHP